jgi:uncharacterized membrane protein YhaH (DUF805 family)
MTASTVFQMANFAAMLGWLILAAGIIFKRPFWRDVVAGWLWPLALSLLYAVLIGFFFFKADGGFDSLAHVQKLFTYEWAALAGWIHYLAFDLFMGAHVARRLIDAGCSRWWLVAMLPLTFMFGPIGFLAAELVLALTRPARTSN